MEMDTIRFDLHAAAPAIALLPPRQEKIDILRSDREIGRDAFDHSCQPRSVRFAGR
jgi:hypothetical protein